MIPLHLHYPHPHPHRISHPPVCGISSAVLRAKRKRVRRRVELAPASKTRPTTDRNGKKSENGGKKGRIFPGVIDNGGWWTAIRRLLESRHPPFPKSWRCWIGSERLGPQAGIKTGHRSTSGTREARRRHKPIRQGRTRAGFTDTTRTSPAPPGPAPPAPTKSQLHTDRLNGSSSPSRFSVFSLPHRPGLSPTCSGSV